MKIGCQRLLLAVFVLALPGTVVLQAKEPVKSTLTVNAPLVTLGDTHISGQDQYRFHVYKTRDILPPEALAVLEKAHGGFAVDRREGKGEIYFALPGAGIIRIENDLQSATLLPTPPSMKDVNIHNTTIWYPKPDSPRLVFPSNDAGKVFTTDLNGNLLHTLDAPTPDTEFDNPPVDAYFDANGKFAPTDVEYLNHMYYITTGYSDLDYVLTAKFDWNFGSLHWNDFAFGGKGKQPGQFMTGHGITVSEGGKRIDVADRPVAEIDRFTRYGQYRSTVHLPEGAFPCDIDYAYGFALVPCLHGKDREKGAPIYLLQDYRVISTIICKAELGLEKFQHVHNAVLTRMDGKLYIVAQAWNPGDFVILEQVDTN